METIGVILGLYWDNGKQSLGDLVVAVEGLGFGLPLLSSSPKPEHLRVYDMGFRVSSCIGEFSFALEQHNKRDSPSILYCTCPHNWIPNK